MRPLIALALAALPVSVTPVLGHGGGLDASGCHHDRKNGGYHCHRGGGSSRPAPSERQSFYSSQGNSGGGVFRNCTEARAAGAAPVYRGTPGYGPHLDRDGDGIGCEPYRGR